MKIAIISDIHDNIPNLEKCLEWCMKSDIEAILCCGDVTNDQTVDFLVSNYDKAIHLIRGNADSFDEGRLKRKKNLIYHDRIARVELLGKFFGMCHEPFLFDSVIKKGNCDIVFYGHTHKPWEEKNQGIRFVNPGTLSGMFQMATFAVYDISTGELVLQIVDRL